MNGGNAHDDSNYKSRGRQRMLRQASTDLCKRQNSPDLSSSEPSASARLRVTRQTSTDRSSTPIARVRAGVELSETRKNGRWGEKASFTDPQSPRWKPGSSMPNMEPTELPRMHEHSATSQEIAALRKLSMGTPW